MPPIWYDAGSFKLCIYNREEHQRPHVAVMVGRRRLATVAVETGEILAGSLSAQQHRRIKKILSEHTEDAIIAFGLGSDMSRSLNWIAGPSKVMKREHDAAPDQPVNPALVVVTGVRVLSRYVLKLPCCGAHVSACLG